MTDADQNQTSLGGDSTPELDFKRIEFPTDRLTIRQIRELEEEVDQEIPDFQISLHQNERGERVPSVCWVMSWERSVALLAFEISLGFGPRFEVALEPNEPVGKPEQADKLLVEAYMIYGMARTTTEAKELLRDIKEQARAQAREAQGRDPDTGWKR